MIKTLTQKRRTIARKSMEMNSRDAVHRQGSWLSEKLPVQFFQAGITAPAQDMCNVFSSLNKILPDVVSILGIKMVFVKKASGEPSPA